MASIGRLPMEYALQVALAKGQQVGVPVNMPAVAQGIQAIVEGLYRDGWNFTVEDRFPVFQICQQIPGAVTPVRGGAGGNGNGQRYAQPAPGPVYAQPAPVYQQPAPPVPMYQQPARAPYQEPIAPTTIIPGQPLPPMAGGAPVGVPVPQAGGMRPAATGPVPVNAPVMKSANIPDAPPSLTEAPQPPAPIFE